MFTLKTKNNENNKLVQDERGVCQVKQTGFHLTTPDEIDHVNSKGDYLLFEDFAK